MTQDTRLHADVTAPNPSRLVATGIAAAVLTGAAEAVYAVARGTGLAGAAPTLLFVFQVVGWTIAAAAPVVLLFDLMARRFSPQWERARANLRNPAVDHRLAIWLATLGIALAIYVGVLFFLAEQHLLGKRARGAAAGSLVGTAAGALVVLATLAFLVARVIVRRTSAVGTRSRPKRRPARVVVAFATVGALHASLVATWLTSSLEVGFGIDLRIAIVPCFFSLAWASLNRLSAGPIARRFAALTPARRTAIGGGVALFAAVALFSTGLRADTDAALLSRSFLPRLAWSLLHRAPHERPSGIARAETEPISDPVDPPPIADDTAAAPSPTPPANATQMGRKNELTPRPNFLLITIDTLRADHLGAYGYTRQTSPEIDRFAKSAVVFTRAYAPAPNTPRSIPSLLTSRYPSQIPWRNAANYPPLPKAVPTLAEDLEAAGYRNHAILTHWYFRRERGLARGFHTWDTSLVDDDIETGREESAPRVTERARRYLARARDAKRPFFLWVHYFEPHHFYILHKGTPTFGTAMMDKYDHEIRFVDREVGRLLKQIDDLGLAKTTTVILTSDHGEAFGEHTKYWHGHGLYDEQVRVPFIVRAPHLAVTSGTSDAVASLVDLRPTLCELAGAKPRGAMAGVSLVSALGGPTQNDRTVFAEILPQPNHAAHQRMVVRGSWKLIEDFRLRSIELYDLSKDAREQTNEATRAPTVVDELRASPARLNGVHP